MELDNEHKFQLVTSYFIFVNLLEITILITSRFKEVSILRNGNELLAHCEIYSRALLIKPPVDPCVLSRLSLYKFGDNSFPRVLIGEPLHT